MNEDLDGAKQEKDMSNLRDMLKEIVEDELEEMDEDLKSDLDARYRDQMMG